MRKMKQYRKKQCMLTRLYRLKHCLISVFFHLSHAKYEKHPCVSNEHTASDFPLSAVVFCYFFLQSGRLKC